MATIQQTNTDVVKQYLNAFNDRNWEELPRFLADDVVEHGIHGKHRGAEEILKFLQRHFRIFPDYAGETEAIHAADDVVMVRYTATGTHTGEYHDVEPTGLKAAWSGIAIYRVEDETIAEIWLEEDRLGLLEQLEAIDPPAHLRI